MSLILNEKEQGIIQRMIQLPHESADLNDLLFRFADMANVLIDSD